MNIQSAEPLIDFDLDKYLTGWALKQGFELFREQIKMSINFADIKNDLFWCRIIFIHGFGFILLGYLASIMSKIHAKPISDTIWEINQKNIVIGAKAFFRRYPKESLEFWNMIEEKITKNKLERITGIKSDSDVPDFLID